MVRLCITGSQLLRWLRPSIREIVQHVAGDLLGGRFFIFKTEAWYRLRATWYNLVTMAIWPFSIFSSDEKSAPVVQSMKQGDRPVLLKAEEEAEKIYKREVWWLEHKTGLRKGVIVFVIAIEAVFGLLAGRTEHRASLEEIHEAAAAGWAGR